MLTKIILLIFVILLAGYFAGIETALMSIFSKKVKSKYGRKAGYFDYWEQNPNHIITAILIGNNCCTIGAGVLSASIALDAGRFSHRLEILVPFLVIIVILFVSEIIPKVYARFNAEKIAAFGVGYIVFLSKLLKPVTVQFVNFAEAIIKLAAPGGHFYEKPFVTSDELKKVLSQEETIGDIGRQGTQMLKNVLSFNERTAEQVMVRRNRIFAVDYNDGLWEIVRKVNRSKYSRVPVYNRRLDNIIGVIYSKDLIMTSRTEKLFVLEDLIRPAHYTARGYHISDLLKEFRKGRHHMSIVLSGERRVIGLVSIEDIIEQIFGKISDEYDSRPK